MIKKIKLFHENVIMNIVSYFGYICSSNRMKAWGGFSESFKYKNEYLSLWAS